MCSLQSLRGLLVTAISVGRRPSLVVDVVTPVSSRQLHWAWAALRGRVCACFLVCFAARPGLRGAPE